jgi:hypothetical protein
MVKILCMYLYENETMKPCKTVQRSWRIKENGGGVNLTEIYRKHVCKSTCTHSITVI